MKKISLCVFGAAGDLARIKLLYSIYELERYRLLPEQFELIGLDVKPLGKDAFRSFVKDALADEGTEPESVETFLGRLDYLQVDLAADPPDLHALAERVDQNALFYLALPPSLFVVAAHALGAAGLADQSRGFRRLVIEKPFGHDLASAAELNSSLHQKWQESQIFRIDHYLGKETVQNLLVLRFANSLFEPLWNRDHVVQVQITVAENVAVGQRGPMYDRVGAFRDIVQNHLMQLFTLSAIEPPARLAGDMLRDEKVKVLRTARMIAKADVDRFAARGQYEGYTSEPGVPAESRTETFAALKLFIDNWRWKGVPFYLRTGKRLRRKYTEIALQFRPPPQELFQPALRNGRTEPNWLVIQLQPEPCLVLELQAKKPALELETHTVTLPAPYRDPFTPGLSDYATMLLAAIEGDHGLFLRFDEVELAWKIVEPVVETWESGGKPDPYAQDSEGPGVQYHIMEDGHRWRRI